MTVKNTIRRSTLEDIFDLSICDLTVFHAKISRFDGLWHLKCPICWSLRFDDFYALKYLIFLRQNDQFGDFGVKYAFWQFVTQNPSWECECKKNRFENFFRPKISNLSTLAQKRPIWPFWCRRVGLTNLSTKRNLVEYMFRRFSLLTYLKVRENPLCRRSWGRGEEWGSDFFRHIFWNIPLIIKCFEQMLESFNRKITLFQNVISDFDRKFKGLQHLFGEFFD